jgi:hypothetical protein
MTDGPIQRRDPPSDPSVLCKLQLDYAWKWFSYHADQRVKMFNFMLIVSGIFATAVVTAMDKGLPSGLTATLCFIAAALGLIFSRLDRRNRDLVWQGEEVLTHLEKNCIFGEGIKIKDRKGKDICLGVLSCQAIKDKCRANNLRSAWRKDVVDRWNALTWDAWGQDVDDAWHGKHRVLLPRVGFLMFGSFLAAGIWILIDP